MKQIGYPTRPCVLDQKAIADGRQLRRQVGAHLGERAVQIGEHPGDHRQIALTFEGRATADEVVENRSD